MITQKIVKEKLIYNADTGSFRWKSVYCPRISDGESAGFIGGDGYHAISINGKAYKAHRIAWLYTYGYMPENCIDHINRVKTDNRIKNLREATRVCNARNAGIFSHNKGGVRGVHFIKSVKRWNAQIKVNGSSKSLGNFKSKVEAACHMLAAEQCLDWAECDKSSSAKKYVIEGIRRINQ